MKRLLSVILAGIVFWTLSFAVEVSEILQRWENSTYKAERIFLEKYGDDAVRMRYEIVYKWGTNKIVKVDSPQEIVWLRNDDGCWIGSEVLYMVPIDIKDLEDIALEAAQEASDVKLKEDNDGYTLVYSTDRGSFFIKLSKDFLPLLIRRKLMKLTMEMEYKEYYSEVPKEEEVKKEFKLSDKKAFPDEIARILRRLEWFSIEREPDSIVIKGVYRNRMISIDITPLRRGRFRRFGRYFVFSKDKEFMEDLLGQ